MFKVKSVILLLAIAAISFSSCRKEELEEKILDEATIPSTYNFKNVSFGGQTTRLNMLQAMTSYMKSGNTSGTSLSATKLKNMFSNENSPFDNAELNAASKQIKNKTFASHVEKFEGYMDALAALSGTTTVAEAGVSGIATTGSKSYLLNENGVEYTQLIEKGLMGALGYYQISEKYTRDEKIGSSIDNETVTEGKGTDMEHHWDEAFGYVGGNVTFDESKYRYHAKYSGKGEDLLKTRTNLMKAFLTGRAAISAKDLDRKDLEAKNVRKYMEETTVTTAIHYLNGGKKNFADYAKRCHVLSEAYAFIGSLKYNADSKISSTDLDNVLSFLQNNSGQPDFANVSIAKLNSAIDKLSSIFGLDAVKDAL